MTFAIITFILYPSLVRQACGCKAMTQGVAHFLETSISGVSLSWRDKTSKMYLSSSGSRLVGIAIVARARDEQGVTVLSWDQFIYVELEQRTA